MTAAGLTHPGLRRDHNEDRYVCDAERGLFVVIDGVGGYASGDVAAELARDLVYQRLRRHQGPSTVRLREAITVANNEIYYRSQLDPAQWGMACVLTAVVVEPGMATVGHVGDTRLYEVRREGLRKVTADHSPVGLREDQGELSEVEAMAHPRRSEILRDVGSTYHHTDDADFVDVYRVPFHADRALLLCSDGLTDLVPSAEIHRLLMLEAGRPDRAAQRLIDAANDAGGHDNITAVVIEGAEYAARVQHADARPGLGPRSRRGRWSWFAAGLLLGLLTAAVPLTGIYHLLDTRLPRPLAVSDPTPLDPEGLPLHTPFRSPPIMVLGTPQQCPLLPPQVVPPAPSASSAAQL